MVHRWEGCLPSLHAENSIPLEMALLAVVLPEGQVSSVPTTPAFHLRISGGGRGVRSLSCQEVFAKCHEDGSSHWSALSPRSRWHFTSALEVEGKWSVSWRCYKKYIY